MNSRWFLVCLLTNNCCINFCSASLLYSLMGRACFITDEPSFPDVCSFNMCPNNCSGRGECRLNNSSNSLECECAKYWKGEACDIPYCTDDCGAPERGFCNFNDTKACVCSAGWQGKSEHYGEFLVKMISFIYMVLGSVWHCSWQLCF